MNINNLSEEEQSRYKRHLLLPEIGPKGQLRLKSARVLVIGAGGLGAPVLFYLAAAGVGVIGIVDGDKVDRSNLQRQIIHATRDVNRYKVESAKEKINALNPNVDVHIYPVYMTECNAPEIIEQYDFVIDATDSFKAKFLVNDVCVAHRKPYNHGAIYRYQGQTMTVLPGTACYRCLFDAMPEMTEVAGPLGVVSGIIGTLQATEAIKYITGIGELLTDKLLTFDSLTMQFNTFKISPNPNCLHHH